MICILHTGIAIAPKLSQEDPASPGIYVSLQGAAAKRTDGFRWIAGGILFQQQVIRLIEFW